MFISKFFVLSFLTNLTILWLSAFTPIQCTFSETQPNEPQRPRPSPLSPNCTKHHQCHFLSEVDSWGVCYLDGHCHCPVGRVLALTPHHELYCKPVVCSRDSHEECEKYGWACNQLDYCTCPDESTSDPAYGIVCIPEASCTQTTDCQQDSPISGVPPLSGSVCFTRRCTCPYGTVRTGQSCTQLRCTKDSDCGPAGTWAHCVKANRTCACKEGAMVASNRMRCIWDWERHLAERDGERHFPQEAHILLIIVFLLALLTVLIIGGIYCIVYKSDPNLGFPSSLTDNQMQKQ